MSDIKPGDLVMVVRPTPCCGSNIGMGIPLRVHRVGVCSWRCDECGKRGKSLMADFGDGSGDAVSRLIRIDPPALPESVETEREVVA